MSQTGSPEPDGTATASGRHSVRAVVAAVVGALAVVVLTASTVAVWASATVLRGDVVAELAGDALAEAEVQEGLAAYITDQIDGAFDLEAVLAAALPDALGPLAPTAARGARAAVERSLERLLANDSVQQTVTTVVERAHERAMRLLQGDGIADGITVDNGEVAINTLPLIARGLGVLQQSAGVLDDVEVPELSADGDPAAQIAELETALDRDLPDGFGQLVVYRSDSVANAQVSVQSAQQMLALATRAVEALVVLTVLLITATIVAAPHRWRALLVLGLGTAAALIVLRSAVQHVVDHAPELATRPGARAAIGAIVSSASSSLLRLTGIGLIVVLAVVVIAVLRGRSRRRDLVLVAAVLVGASTVGVLGLSIPALVAGVVVGVAIPLLAGWVLPPTDPATIPSR